MNKSRSVLLFVNLFINRELRNRPAPEGEAGSASAAVSCSQEAAGRIRVNKFRGSLKSEHALQENDKGSAFADLIEKLCKRSK